MIHRYPLLTRRLIRLGLALSLCLTPLVSRPAPPLTITEVIRQAIKKVIVAVDLKIQRLQNETLWLQNAQKAVENALSKFRLREIHDWSEKQKQQYQVYFQQLQQVKQWIRTYRLVRQMMEKQVAILYQQQVLTQVRAAGYASPAQVQHMEGVFAGILEQSDTLLQGLQQVLGQGLLSMSDAERIARIQELNKILDKQLRWQGQFIHQNHLWFRLRQQDRNEVNYLQELYGID